MIHQDDSLESIESDFFSDIDDDQAESLSGGLARYAPLTPEERQARRERRARRRAERRARRRPQPQPPVSNELTLEERRARELLLFQLRRGPNSPAPGANERNQANLRRTREIIGIE